MWIRLVGSDDVNVEREEVVYTAVMKWINENIDSRREYLPELLKCVRLCLLERSYLVMEVGMEPLIRSCNVCRDLVDKAKDFLLLPERRSSMAGPHMLPRRKMQGGEALVVVGGWCNGDAIATVEMYSSKHDDWKVVATMTKRRCGVGVTNLNDILYAVCGHDGSTYLNSVERYDPNCDQWSCQVAAAGCSRTSVGVAVLGDCIYAVGGQDGSACLSLVERYNPSTNKWQQVCSMTSPRLGVGVASLGGCLYAVGGSDGSSPLASVERYNPQRDEWTLVSPMSEPRKHLGAAVLNGLLYAVGGRNHTTELRSVERYDPQLDQWTGMIDMTCCRSGVGLAVLNSQLFAVGGFDGSSYLKSVEWLDEKDKQWKLAGSMSYRRLGCGVGVVWTTRPS
jgi:kelch-like protein 20